MQVDGERDDNLPNDARSDPSSTESIIGAQIDDAIAAQDGDGPGKAQGEGEGGQRPQRDQPARVPGQQRDQQGARRDATATKPGQQQQQQQRDTGPARAGDLLDQQGNVLARAGAERRMYERVDSQYRPHLTKLGGALRELDGKYREAAAQVKAYEQSNAVMTQAGLSPQEMAIGASLVAGLKKDTAGTIRKLLTDAKASGINIEGLSGPQIDSEAIAAMIEKKLAPFTQDRSRAQEAQQVTAKAHQEVAQFFANFPDAKVHEPLLAELVTRDPTLTPREAYFRAKLWFNDQGLDWSRPLQEQQGGGGQQQQQSNGRQQQRPMPNGRGGASYDGEYDEGAGSGTAEPSMSNDEIVRSAMREAGYRVR